MAGREGAGAPGAWGVADTLTWLLGCRELALHLSFSVRARLAAARLSGPQALLIRSEQVGCHVLRKSFVGWISINVASLVRGQGYSCH